MKLFKVFMLHSAFLPLWLSILVLTLDHCKSICSIPVIVGVILFAFSVYASFSLMKFMKKVENSTNDKAYYKLKKIEKKSTLVIEYVFANVLPLSTFNYDELSGWIVLFIFYLLIFIIEYKNDYYFINPIYELLGWSYYEVTLEKNEEVLKCLLIKRNKSKFYDDDSISLYRINDYVYVYAN